MTSAELADRVNECRARVQGLCSDLLAAAQGESQEDHSVAYGALAGCMCILNMLVQGENDDMQSVLASMVELGLVEVVPDAGGGEHER